MKLEENVSEKQLRGGKQRRRKSLFFENLKIKAWAPISGTNASRYPQYTIE
jgi:hypothetical protein